MKNIIVNGLDFSEMRALSSLLKKANQTQLRRIRKEAEDKLIQTYM